MDILDMLTIHKWDIKLTFQKIKDVFNELNLNLDGLEELTMQQLIGQAISEDLGNQIIGAMLEAAKTMLLEQVSPFEPEVEIYCNGLDSHLFVEESDKDIIKAATLNNLDYNYVRWLYDQISHYDDFEYLIENDIIYHESIQNLIDADIKLCWDDAADAGFDNPEEKEAEFLNAPGDTDITFLYMPSGRYYVPAEENKEGEKYA